ncbi:MAG: dihydroorotate dehydrogenase [Candidatus Magnetobacterium sp. LHC-1]|uniref:Dihydroorotate dehydrogenase n=1 Tax=Candidatus Magnetobacterium casense TaxID=1455061 RepID=A0ABS6RXT2_9BACT|nr:dihydroorotate dehydrogenase [Candidatus Magnetobacterium casensis]MBF0608345.1 dihydroorotate dehydrogenase [Nitrospirota bacterium]MBV6341435.1 dihydroorotate dehydrogenase [Candidatus Magnetobacterium casensis]
MNLKVFVAGLQLKNPVMTASGTFGYGLEYAEFFDLSRLGGIVVKGLSVKPSQGNPPPRIWETSCGMLNSIGLQNIGIPAFVRDRLPLLRRYDTRIIVNFFGDTIADFAEGAAMLNDAVGVDALELNVSCPNKDASQVRPGAIKNWSAFGTNPVVLAEVVGQVRRATSLPLIVKLSPNVTDITEMARVAVDAGADALSLINTLTGMAIDIETRRPRLSNIVGGLSGPAIKPVALRMLWQVHRALPAVPLIGMGGVMTGADAIEFILAGATAVAIGTANFVNPQAALHVIDGIEQYMAGHDIANVNDLVGCVAC